MITKYQNRLLEYEREKARLLEECTTVEQYQEEIKKVIARLKI